MHALHILSHLAARQPELARFAACRAPAGSRGAAVSRARAAAEAALGGRVGELRVALAWPGWCADAREAAEAARADALRGALEAARRAYVVISLERLARAIGESPERAAEIARQDGWVPEGDRGEFLRHVGAAGPDGPFAAPEASRAVDLSPAASASPPAAASPTAEGCASMSGEDDEEEDDEDEEDEEEARARARESVQALEARLRGLADIACRLQG